MVRLTGSAVILLLAAGAVWADLTVFENDPAGWQAAAGGPAWINTINWDDVGPLAEGGRQVIAADRYSALPGSPTLSVTGGSLYVGNPDNPNLPNDTTFFGYDFYAVSGDNVFSPDQSGSPEGILTITFDTPMTAAGVWFLDVEDDHLGSGLTAASGNARFSTNQGDDSQSFLGIISGTPFTTLQIHMSSIGGGNGVGIDDVMYSPIPAPGAVVLGAVGLGLAAWIRRRA
jgi:hypothetical protein